MCGGEGGMAPGSSTLALLAGWQGRCLVWELSCAPGAGWQPPLPLPTGQWDIAPC